MLIFIDGFSFCLCMYLLYDFSVESESLMVLCGVGLLGCYWDVIEWDLVEIGCVFDCYLLVIFMVCL